MRVELSGGIVSRAAIEAGLALGPQRVNIATQALGDIDAVCEAVDACGERVAVCLDVRGDRLSARGVNRDLLARVADATQARIIASGGVNSLADIEALRALGIEGAIVGKALYQGAFTLADALAVAGYGER